MKDSSILKYTGNEAKGLLLLGLSIAFSVAAQFLLKMAMIDLGSFTVVQSLNYLYSMMNMSIISGLMLYGVGTILWLLCLKMLDLGFAYPVATFQYILVFFGAWYLFDESINWLRLTGLGIICMGVIVMSRDLKNSKK